MATTRVGCLFVFYILLCSQTTQSNLSAKTSFNSTVPGTSNIIENALNSNTATTCGANNFHFGNSTDDNVKTFQSFADKSCNFTITVESGMGTVIQVELFEPHDTIFSYFYVKRAGITNLTSKRIVSIPLNQTLQQCGAQFFDEHYTVYVQANVTFSLLATNLAHRTFAGSDDPRIINTNAECANLSCGMLSERCQPLQMYHQVVSCTTTTVSGKFTGEETVVNCDINCPSNCQCQIGHRNVTHNCPGQEVRNILLAFPTREGTTLNISNMNISSVLPSSFTDFRGFYKLDLSGNNISELHSDTFTGLSNLKQLRLERNNIGFMNDDVFKSLTKLTYLDMTSNNLSDIKAPMFDHLKKLIVLHLKDNQIVNLDPLVFRETTSLEILDLSSNKIAAFEPGTLHGLSNLWLLYLARNELTSITCGTFNGLTSVNTLTLSHNKLKTIDRNTFVGLDGLSYLLLKGNHLHKLESSIFSGLISLKSLDLRLNSLSKLRIDTFNGITNRTSVLVDNHSVCCFVKEANCMSTYPKQAFLTCGQLLPYYVLRVVLSILGSLALVGNVMVMYWRCRIRRRDNKVQFLLIVNLSASDFLMGIYMIIIVSGDVHFGELFPLEADAWRRSGICKLAGFLAMLSSEASAFFVTLISIDRLLGVKYPFSSHRLGNKSAKIAVTGVWFLAITVSVILTLLARIDPDMYTLSEVCIGLPLARRWVNNPQNITVYLGNANGNENVEISQTVRTEPGMYLSIAIFLGLNLLCFLIIAYCYIVIFVTAQRTSRKASRRREKDEEIRMAAKMSVIVITDFLCWMPIILIGILVQSGAVTIRPVVYAWIVTFVLPINSSANPFLYTMATIITDRVGLRQRGSSIDSQCGRKLNGTQYYPTDQYEQVINGHAGTTYECLEGSLKDQEGNV